MKPISNELNSVDDSAWTEIHARLESLAPPLPPIANDPSLSRSQVLATQRLHRAVFAARQLLATPQTLRIPILNWMTQATPHWVAPWWHLIADAVTRLDETTSTLVPDGSASSLIAAAAQTPRTTKRTSRSQASPASEESFEPWFASLYPTRRRQLGVFHTPPPLARALWSQVTQHSASSDHPDILDPAAGIGTFLIAACQVEANRAGLRPAHRIDAIENVLARFDCVEISLDAWILGPLFIARAIAELGHDLHPRNALRWWLADATDPHGTRTAELAGDASLGPSTNAINDTETRAWRVACRKTLTLQNRRLIVGNPPYSSRVEGSNRWIEQLLRGEIAGPGGNINYYQCQGQPLGERKTWLHDLYVRFLRLSHWWTAQSPQCCVALITNRGWLDHTTFRGLREAILADFPDIQIDLPTKDSGNWFNVTTPTAIVTLQRSASHDAGPRVRLGYRNPISATDSLIEEQPRREFEHLPAPPRFNFLISTDKGSRSLGSTPRVKLWQLPEIFLECGSTIVTGRDDLTVATSRHEARERLAMLLDPSVPDELLIERHFRRSRSRRFAPGQARGFHLTQARIDLRQRYGSLSAALKAMLRPCRYRALDDRWLLYDRALIAWPRWQAQATLLLGDEAIVARRQSPADRPFDFVTSVNRLVLDGVLRSDNRGNETLFPRHRLIDSQLVSNWSSQWLTATAPLLPPASRETPDPDRLRFGYLFALLRSPSMRESLHSLWVTDFPGVPLIENKETFQAIARLGSALADLHQSPRRATFSPAAKTSSAVAAIGDNPERDLGLLPPEIREATLGAHRILGRWLRDRRHQIKSASTLRRFQRLIQTVQRCLELESQIDQILSDQVGWSSLLGPPK